MGVEVFNPLAVEYFLDVLHIFAYIFLNTYYLPQIIKFIMHKVLLRKFKH